MYEVRLIASLDWFRTDSFWGLIEDMGLDERRAHVSLIILTGHIGLKYSSYYGSVKVALIY